MQSELFFENTEVAFAGFSTKKLKRAKRLFSMMGKPKLVAKGEQFMLWALKNKLPVKWIIKSTIFRQFCGGEDFDECLLTIDDLAQARIQTILDYAVEGNNSEASFEQVKNEILKIIDFARYHKSEVPFIVFKMTGIARFELLEKMAAQVPLSEGEIDEYRRIKDRVYEICSKAYQNAIPIMIDAEESWIQEPIDVMVMEMALEFNKEKPMVYHTLQMYRHDRLDYLEQIHAFAKMQNIKLGIKLVRGAYLDKENLRAGQLNMLSPIHKSKTNTDNDYNAAIKYCLNNISDIAICIASHNENSCSVAMQCMLENGIHVQHSNVSFAQLYGMSNHISYNLAEAGYKVCKYVPYGPVEKVMPYLIRRAKENTAVAGQTGRELALIQKELKRRKYGE